MSISAMHFNQAQPNASYPHRLPSPASAAGAQDNAATAASAERVQPRANPIQANPIQANPIQSNPTQSNPAQSNPTQSNPTQANPTSSRLDIRV
jgi:hypothetical protein